MSSNSQKTPVARSVTQAAQKGAAEAIQILGKALPCSVVSVMGSIVTVKFELTNIPFTIPNTMMAVAMAQYIRLPLKAGDMGVALPADARLGGVTGLGVGTADLSTPANLAALAFFPLGNKTWEAPDNANSIELYGPDGFLLRNSTNTDTRIKGTTTEIDINAKTQVIIKVNGVQFLKVSAAGVEVDGNLIVTGNLQIAGAFQGSGGATYSGPIHTTGTVTGDGDVVASGKSLKAHVHTGVVVGGSSTGPNT